MGGVFDLSALSIIFFLVAADQAAKLLVASSMGLGMSIPVLPGIFHITYIENAGAAFGMFANQRWLFVAAAVCVIAAACVMHRRLAGESGFTRLGAALLLGGAVGNLIDRVRIGRVIDFLDFRVWPVFNIADIGICVGVAVLMHAMLCDAKKGNE